MDFSIFRYLIVGAGFFGSVLAERIANDRDEPVLVIEKRDHIGGNCYSQVDPETEIEYHRYGTHIFHTSKQKVWEYINRFTSFNGYRHQVLASYQNRVYQMPINLETINSFFGLNLRPFEVGDFLKSEVEKENITNPKSLEDKAVSLVGRKLYEAFIKGYTIKQWQKDPRELPASIIQRLPVRKNYDENYYFDQWQGIPSSGYSEIFKKMLNHRKIEFHLKTDFFVIKPYIPKSCHVIYSGAIDRFFDYKYGKLEWRALEFEREVLYVEDYQGTAVMNFTELAVPYTRIHEPRHLHPDRNYSSQKTLIFREYPKTGTADNPYYPVNTSENQKIYSKYLEERSTTASNIIFGGRLGHYKYYDMDQVISDALDIYEGAIKNRWTPSCLVQN